MPKTNTYNTSGPLRSHPAYQLTQLLGIGFIVMVIATIAMLGIYAMTPHDHKTVRHYYDSNNIRFIRVTMCYTTETQVKWGNVHEENELSKQYFNGERLP